MAGFECLQPTDLLIAMTSKILIDKYLVGAVETAALPL
jgi:hypothetical protein